MALITGEKNLDVMASSKAVAGSTIATLAALHELYPEMTSKAIDVDYIVMILDSDVPLLSQLALSRGDGESLLLDSWDNASMIHDDGINGKVIRLDDSKVLVDDTPENITISTLNVLEQILLAFNFPHHHCTCDACKCKPDSVKFDVDYTRICNRAKETCYSIVVKNIMMGDVPVVIGNAW